MTDTANTQLPDMTAPLVLTWWTIGVYECENLGALDAILAGTVDGRYTVWDIDEDDLLLHIGPDTEFRSSQDLDHLRGERAPGDATIARRDARRSPERDPDPRQPRHRPRRGESRTQSD